MNLWRTRSVGNGIWGWIKMVFLDWLSNIISKMEFSSELKQRHLFKSIDEPIVRMTKEEVEDWIPRIFMAKPDPTELLVIFYEPHVTKLGLHLVFSDEVFPISKTIDEMYREFRREKFGRTIDIESVLIDLSAKNVIFETTYSGPNPYEVPIHHSATEPITGRLFVNTWNHMMSTGWSPLVGIRHGYKEVTGFELVMGTRDDAEKFAKSL